MQDLVQLGVRNAIRSAADRRHTSNGRLVERVAKGIATHHPCRADDYKPFLVDRSNVHLRLPGTASACVDPIPFAKSMFMIVLAPPASRHRAAAPQTAMCRRSSRTGPNTGEPQSSVFAFHHRS